MKNILITRPQEQAVELADVFAKHGDFPFIEPLFEVEKIFPSLPSNNFSALVVTSINACQVLENSGFDRQIKIFTVGKITARKLRQMGFNNVILSPENSAKSLENLIAQEKGNILYLRGSKISFDFAKSFAAISEILVYKIHEKENFSAQLLNFAKKRRFDEVLLFSRNSAEIFFKLAIKHNLLEYFLEAQIFCLSENIRSRAEEFGFKKTANFSNHSILKNIYD